MTTDAGNSSRDRALSLAAEFPEATREQWQRLAEKALGRTDGEAAEPVERALATVTYDGITIDPLYTAADASPPAGWPGTPPFVRGAAPAGGVITGWEVRQRHADPDTAATGQAIRDDLAGGTGGLWLVLGDAGIPLDLLEAVLDGVDISAVGITLDAGADAVPAARALLDLYRRRGIPPSAARGCLGLDPLGHLARTGVTGGTREAAAFTVDAAGGYPGMRAMVVDATPFHEAGGADAQELGCAMAVGVAYLRALLEAGLSIDDACAQLEFRLAVTADQFLDIAKLRAVRRMWDRVTEVCGASPRARAAHQHAVTSAAMMAARDPYTNMLRTTLACFGAGIGGAEAVTVAPFDAAIGLPDAFARRIARNTQALLIEEAHLAQVIDPAGGSWYVERLTEELARAGWGWFQRIESAGGIEAALDSGALARWLDEVWQRRRANLAHRRDPLTGVSEFPEPGEPPARVEPARAPHGGLPRVRYSVDFEELRARADAYRRRTGSPPRALLATLGSQADYTQRAAFAANLLRAGGIDGVECGATTDVDEVVKSFRSIFDDGDGSLACLCGSDDAYARLAEPVATSLKQAGAKLVWLAGSPPAAGYDGVDAYAREGCDAVAMLTEALEILGVGR